MSTEFYRLKKPFTSARTTVGGSHTQLALWVNHAKAGEITLRNEEVAGVLGVLCCDDAAVIRRDDGSLVFYDDELKPGMTLISEHGDLMTPDGINT